MYFNKLMCQIGLISITLMRKYFSLLLLVSIFGMYVRSTRNGSWFIPEIQSLLHWPCCVVLHLDMWGGTGGGTRTKQKTKNKKQKEKKKLWDDGMPRVTPR